MPERWQERQQKELNYVKILCKSDEDKTDLRNVYKH